MKNTILGLLALVVCPMSAHAGAEILQILVFDWDEQNSQMVLKSLGSGTAIDNNLVLTNKHVVEYSETEAGDLMLLCQAQARQSRQSNCSISAGIVSLHPEFDVALLRSVSDSVFLPKVKLSRGLGYVGQNVRVIGFPAPVEGVQGFGGTSASSAVQDWLNNPKAGLSLKGDSPTTTRGRVVAKARVKETGESLLYTNARVNFGNSGGAAFDQFGRYIGIPTFMDKDGNAFILEYWQLGDWVDENKDKASTYSAAAQDFFARSTGQKKTKSTSTNRWANRTRSVRVGTSDRRTTTRRYSNYSRQSYPSRNYSTRTRSQ